VQVTTVPTDQTGEQDANELAQSELAANTVPTPDDVLADVGPLAVLWYARELAYYAVKFWSATLSADEAADIGDTSELGQALEALSLAAGNLDGACVLVSLLPSDYDTGAS
jgi:hypothetical protein